MKKGVGRLPCQILATTTEVLKPSLLEPKNLNPLWDEKLKTLDTITAKV